MGSLSAAFDATPPAVSGKRCGVAKLLEELDDEDRAWLAAAAADKTVDASRLSRALAAEGHRLSDQIIRRHRNGCSCAAR